MIRLFRGFEYLTFIASICAVSMGLISLYLKIFNMAPPVSSQIVHVPILLAMLVVMFVRFREMCLGAMSALPFVLIMILAVGSFKWSNDPGFTLREAIISTVFVAYMATMAWRYSWKDLINGMWIAMIGMVLVSYILYFGVPSIGKMSEIHTGTMSGLWLEKNGAG